MSMVELHRLRVGFVLFGGCALFAGVLQAQDAEQPVAEAAAEEPAADPFAVPKNATAEELLAFIQSVRQPSQPPKTREEVIEFLEKSTDAISQAADLLLSGETTVDQKIEATRAKIQALSMAARLGNPQADAELEAFLETALQSDTAELVQLAKQMRTMRQIGKWNQLEPPERQAVIDGLVADVKQTERPTAAQAQLVSMLANLLADTPEREQAATAVEELIPAFQKSADSGVASRLATLEGLVRRLRLPGSVMELRGTLLNGEPLDWDTYRGKVVLVDYWATWCQPCRDEVPNVIENYRAYHDKGFEVLGISLDKDKALVEEYMETSGVPWVTLFSSDEGANGWNHPMAKFYGINAIPAAILVDAEGKVVDMQARGQRLGAKLQELLGDPLPPPQTSDDPPTADSTAQTSTTAPK